MISIWVPGIPPSPNDRMHWRRKARLCGDIRDAVVWQLRTFRPPTPFQRAKVTITIVKPRGVEFDDDNAVALCKPAIDGIVRGGVLVDDSKAHIERVVLQARGPERGLKIEVEQVA